MHILEIAIALEIQRIKKEVLVLKILKEFTEMEMSSKEVSGDTHIYAVLESDGDRRNSSHDNSAESTNKHILPTDHSYAIPERNHDGRNSSQDNSAGSTSKNLPIDHSYAVLESNHDRMNSSQDNSKHLPTDHSYAVLESNHDRMNSSQDNSAGSTSKYSPTDHSYAALESNHDRRNSSQDNSAESRNKHLPTDHSYAIPERNHDRRNSSQDNSAGSTSKHLPTDHSYAVLESNHDRRNSSQDNSAGSASKNLPTDHSYAVLESNGGSNKDNTAVNISKCVPTQHSYESVEIPPEAVLESEQTGTRGWKWVKPRHSYEWINPGPKSKYLTLNRNTSSASLLNIFELDDKSSNDDGGKPKCSARMIAGVIVALCVSVVVSVLFIAAFVEIATLRSEVASLRHKSKGDKVVSDNLTMSLRDINDTRRFNLSKLDHRLNLLISELNASSRYNLAELENDFNTKLENVSDQLQQLHTELNVDTVRRGERLSSLNISLKEISEEVHLYHPLYYASCAAVPTSYPSGYYWVSSFNGSSVRVYCDMTRSCGGITGGWMRVAELDMRDSASKCPSGLNETMSSNVRTCIQTESGAGCSTEIKHSSGGIQYSHVCGQIRAYQMGSLEGFTSNSTLTPDANYVDGVSLTHGMNHSQHIWSFAAGPCPCSINRPDFVGNDFTCDLSSNNEALWDGVGCGNQTTPWFYKRLPQPITDEIQMRVCRDQNRSDEDIAIEIVDIFVH